MEGIVVTSESLVVGPILAVFVGIIAVLIVGANLVLWIVVGRIVLG